MKNDLISEETTAEALAVENLSAIEFKARHNNPKNETPTHSILY